MKQLMVVLGSAFPDKLYTINDLIAEDDKVVARWTLKATHKGDYMGIPPTNKQIILNGIYIIRIENGKQVEWWLEADFLSLMQQLGVIPSM
jgi:predicted ester cyclase